MMMMMIMMIMMIMSDMFSHHRWRNDSSHEKNVSYVFVFGGDDYLLLKTERQYTRVAHFANSLHTRIKKKVINHHHHHHRSKSSPQSKFLHWKTNYHSIFSLQPHHHYHHHHHHHQFAYDDDHHTARDNDDVATSSLHFDLHVNLQHCFATQFFIIWRWMSSLQFGDK